MNNRERTLAILNYQPYDRLPVVHFGYWTETLEKWAAEGHITKTLSAGWYHNNAYDRVLCERLGFDFGWGGIFGPHLGLQPGFRRRVLAEFPDGSRHVLDDAGAIVLEKDDVVSIPAEIDHLLKGRAEWERIFRPRLRFSQRRLDGERVNGAGGTLRFGRGGREYLLAEEPTFPRGLWCGSLFGIIRNWLGVVGLSYLTADDPALLEEMIETVAELSYQGTAAALATGIPFDYGHFWEDICFKNGPLVNPRLFARLVGPHYRRITRSAERPRRQHRLAGLRRHDRQAAPDLARERCEHDVPDRGRHLARQHRAVAGAVWPRTARRGRHGQEGLRLRLRRGRRRDRTAQAAGGRWAATSPARTTDSARCEVGERAVLLRARAARFLDMRQVRRESHAR